MPNNLLENDSSSEVEFSINKSYADNYDTWRRKEELQKFKDRYGKAALDGSEEDRSSTSSSDDDTDMESTALFDKEFYHTLSCLKAKDPIIYDKSTNFFENVDQLQKNEERKSGKKTKPIYLRDYERNLILEKGGILSDEDDGSKINSNARNKAKIDSLSYFEEQESIKESFKKALGESQEEDEEKTIGGLFSTRMKSSEEKAEEEDEYAAWLEGRKDELKSEEEEKGLSVLRSYWSDPSLDAGEAFLRDYILQKKFTTKGKGKRNFSKDCSHLESDNDSLEEEEREIKQIEEFEHKFNFRFEEPDQEFIKRFPRTMDSTLRKKDDKRKQKRKELQNRKEAEMQRHKEELCKAKELKRKEIEARLQQLCTVTGNTEIGFKGEDLEADFDPQEHDRRMNELFSHNSFYAATEEEKPDFSSIDDELDIEEWNNWNVGEKGRKMSSKQHSSQASEGLHSEDPNFIMDCEYDPGTELNGAVEVSEGRKAKRERGQRRRGVNSKLAKGLKLDKPLFDPLNFLSKAQQNKGSEAFEKYVDEYYGLDFEDVIGGDLPCRFKYRKVMPNDYGLSVEEILGADDKELNRWCSLKKALRIKPEENEKYDLQAYRKKGANMKLKQKVFASLYSNTTKGSDESKTKIPKRIIKMAIEDSGIQGKDQANPGECSGSNNVSTALDVELPLKEGMDRVLKRKRGSDVKSTACNTKDGVGLVKLKKKKGGKLVREGKIAEEEQSCGNKLETGTKRRRKKGRQQPGRDSYLFGITKSRLKAYGINPKKFKNKLKYKQSE